MKRTCLHTIRNTHVNESCEFHPATKKNYLRMKEQILYKSFLFILCLVSITSHGQQAILSTGGNSANGMVSYSFGQFACQTYFYAGSSVAQGVQHPWETFSQAGVPPNFSLENTTINYATCYNALQNITVAGNGTPVNLQSSAVVEFIAGQSIRFLPGFHAQTGCYVAAHITTSGEYCDFAPPAPIVQAEPLIEKSIEFENNDKIQQNPFNEKQIKLYPNPNNGRFTLQLQNFEDQPEIIVFNMLGMIVSRMRSNSNKTFEMDLPKVAKGIYNVRVSDGYTMQSIKMIVQ